MKKLVLSIINYNDSNSTIKLINNIKKYKVIDLILVIDNNSTDNSYKELKKYQQNNIVVEKTKENKGYAYALNFAAKKAEKLISDDFNIIFSNADVIIDKEEDLVNLSKNVKGNIVVSSPTIKELNTLNRGWKLSTVTDEILFNLPFISRSLKKKILYKEECYNKKTTEVEVVSGCFFMVDSKVLKEINYFDESTFLYYEENIFSKKLKENNYKLVVSNDVSIIHDHSVTIDKNINKIRKYKILKKSQEYYVKEYLKANKLQLILLKLTNNLSLYIMYIRCFFKGGMKK